MKYFLIAGEASGDNHGARLIESIKTLDQDAQFEFWGGDKMAQASGKNPKKHIRNLAFMGFVEVIRNLPTILFNFKKIKTEIIKLAPDRIIYIDYPGFNLRLVKWAKKLGFHNTYYISPTVWAWKPERKELIRNFVDQMLVILPFEKNWYKQHQIEVTYVGNPVVEQVKDFKPDIHFKSKHHLGNHVLALLPGSRKQEIQSILPVMIEASMGMDKTYDLVIAKPDFLDLDVYAQVLNKYPNNRITLIENDFYNILSVADGAMVASGTATLETALFNVPQVVCYKTSRLNYFIAKMLVSLKFISLVNLICESEVVVELIQNDLTKEKLTKALMDILEMKNEEQIKLYSKLHELLDVEQSPSKTAALLIVNQK
ncbi:MAG: lipid-A-disaccharide synthase [Saprospiraceae bacterium]